MRLLFGILFLFLNTVVIGQNYRPINSNTARFFGVDSAAADYGFRTDTTSVYGSDTTYYTYSTFRFSTDSFGDECVKLNAIAFMGNRITVLDNGFSLFFDEQEDTVWLKHSASLNESWVLFEQSADTILKGEVNTIDQQSWLGLQETVKTISISAFDTQNQPISHPVNGQQIIIGETLGILRFPILHNWPNEPVTASAVGDQSLDIGVRNLTTAQIYDFETCDEFHYQERYENASETPPDDRYFKKTILDKQISGELVTYIIQTEGYRYFQQPVTGFPPYVTAAEPISHTDTFSYSLGGQIGLALFPDEFQLDSIGQFSIGWKKPNRFGKLGNRVSNGLDLSYPEYYINADSSIDLSICNDEFSDGCCPCCPYDNHLRTYSEGLGITEIYTVTGSTPTPRRMKLVYYKKCGEEWGVPITESLLNGINREPVIANFNLYPNPATETVQIQLKQQEEVEVLVTDALGRAKTLKQVQGDRAELDVSDWPNGVYLISVINQKGIRSTQRLVVQH